MTTEDCPVESRGVVAHADAHIGVRIVEEVVNQRSAILGVPGVLAGEHERGTSRLVLRVDRYTHFLDQVACDAHAAITRRPHERRRAELVNCMRCIPACMPEGLQFVNVSRRARTQPAYVAQLGTRLPRITLKNH